MDPSSNRSEKSCENCAIPLVGPYCHRCGKPHVETPGYHFERLLGIMDELREKCPWDRKQTIESLRPLTIEETYELADEIMKKNWNGICEELGDLLLHIVFYVRIASEQHQFDIKSMINGICDKLVTRHPHIYGDLVLEDDESVSRNWEKIKLKSGKKSVLEGVPNGLPAMIKAVRLQEKASKVGFDWEHIEHVWAKVEEEIRELKSSISNSDALGIQKEMGDVFFAMINYARFLDVDPDFALEKTNQKFISRFCYIERQAAANQLQIHDLTPQEMNEYWEDSKKENP
jgi:XTP/dITP diphosphohydrolase